MTDQEISKALKEAEKLLQEAESSLGPDHPVVADCLENYAKLLKQSGRADAEIGPLKSRVRQIRGEKDLPLVKAKAYARTEDRDYRGLLWFGIPVLGLLAVVLFANWSAVLNMLHHQDRTPKTAQTSGAQAEAKGTSPIEQKRANKNAENTTTDTLRTKAATTTKEDEKLPAVPDSQSSTVSVDSARGAGVSRGESVENVQVCERLRKQNNQLKQASRGLTSANSQLKEKLFNSTDALSQLKQQLENEQREIEAVRQNLKLADDTVHNNNETIAQLTMAVANEKRRSQQPQESVNFNQQDSTESDSAEPMWANVPDFFPERYKDDLTRRLYSISSLNHLAGANVQMSFSIEKDGHPANIRVVTGVNDEETKELCLNYIQAAGPFRPLLSSQLEHLDVNAQLTDRSHVGRVRISNLSIEALGNRL